MTFEQAFLKIKEKFENADASKTADFAIQITFTDEDCGGTFYAEVKDGKLAVEPYDYYDNDVILNISKSALLAFLGGRSTLDAVVANGSAYVYGDASKIKDWKKTIVKASAKKAPAKKTASKTAPKKTPAKTSKKAPAKTSAKAEITTPAKTAAKTETKAAPKAEIKATAKAAPKAETKATAKTAPKTETKTPKTTK